LVIDLIQLLEKQNLSLAVAESCTGGLLSSWITAEPGVSGVFFGSVVSYTNFAKESILGVHHESIQTSGAVSEVVVREMARGARDLFKASWSVAITGIAGPTGGSAETPIGFIWVGVCGPFFESAVSFVFDGDRKAIQQSSARAAIERLIDSITAQAENEKKE
jgi:PncC family amidohydrolase